MINVLLATGGDALWILVIPPLIVTATAAVLAAAWLLWIWRGGRSGPDASSERSGSGDDRDGSPVLTFGVTGAGAPLLSRYLPFVLLAALALAVATWLYREGFLQGVWSR